MKARISQTFYKNCTGMRVPNIFHKCVLLFSKDMFIHQSSPSKDIGCHIINRINSISSTSQDQSFHVPSLCSPKGNYLPKQVCIHKKQPYIYTHLQIQYNGKELNTTKMMALKASNEEMAKTVHVAHKYIWQPMASYICTCLALNTNVCGVDRTN